MGFSREEYQSGLPFPSPGDLPNAGIEPRSPTLQADALPSEPPGKPWFQRAASNSCLSGKGENAETKEEQSRNNGAASGQGPHSTSGNGHNNLWVLLQELRPPPRYRRVGSGWTPDSCNTTLLPHHQPVRELCTSYSCTLRFSPTSTLLKPFPEVRQRGLASQALATMTSCLVLQ